MPWSKEDATKHKKGLTPEQSKKWARIANAVLHGCMKDVGDSKKCEAMAIKVANEKCVQTKRMVK